MSKSSFGTISNELSYTHREFGRVMGMSEEKARDFFFDHVDFHPLMEGVYVASGRLINFAIERLSQADTPEKKEARKKKSGWDTRRAKAAAKAKEADE